MFITNYEIKGIKETKIYVIIAVYRVPAPMRVKPQNEVFRNIFQPLQGDGKSDNPAQAFEQICASVKVGLVCDGAPLTCTR